DANSWQTWRLKAIVWVRCLGMGLIPQRPGNPGQSQIAICPAPGAHSIAARLFQLRFSVRDFAEPIFQGRKRRK
ncbi:MAG TPA: hypothetical protein VGU20_02040, partial [Stellaceae bacterium]|nr:hypothetical protein [Stellaceae bacterium]